MIATLTADRKYLVLKYASDAERDQLIYTYRKKVRNAFFKQRKNPHSKTEVNFLLLGDRLPVGLWYDLGKTCQRFGFELKFTNYESIIDPTVKEEFVEKFCREIFKHNTDLMPRPKQIDAIYRALYYRYSMLDLSTSAGKTLMMYCMMMLLFYTKRIKKLLIICPDPGQVIQNYNEFVNLSRGRFELKVGLIYGNSKTDDFSKPVIMGNFQSLIVKDTALFEEFDAVMIDEGHRVVAKSTKTIIDNCGTLLWRTGYSGSIIVDNSADYYSLLAYTGPVVKKMKKRELIDDGHATDIIVQTFFIDYMSEDEKRDIYMAKKTFDDGEKALRYEQRMIRGSSKRLDWLAALAGKCVGNAIIFFLDIEGGYGHQIVERLKKTTSGKNIFYIDGSVPESHRQVFKQRMEESDNNLLVASYDTFSTGKSIKNLHYIICAEGRKSETAISQAMGRLMRLLSGKDHGTWIDIVDDLSITIREGGEDVRHDNYMIKWFKERKKYYESEDFKHNIHHINIKDYLFG